MRLWRFRNGRVARGGVRIAAGLKADPPPEEPEAPTVAVACGQRLDLMAAEWEGPLLLPCLTDVADGRRRMYNA